MRFGMASVKDKFIVNGDNSCYLVNPEFISEGVTAKELDDYFDIDDYKKSARVIDVHHGRGATYLVQDKYKRRIVIRHYYRGGFIGRILEDKFLKFFKSSRRSFNEFELLITMKKMGLSVPKPIVARMEKNFLFVRNDIIMLEIPGTKNLEEILSERRLSDAEILKVGDALGRLFKAGIYHSDLNITNILFDGANNVWIVDFDKCIQKTINKKQYNSMVERLNRSFEKIKSKRNNFNWTKDNWNKLDSAIKSSFEKDY